MSRGARSALAVLVGLVFVAARRGAQGSQEIAHGTASTGTDGTFKIEFVAKPDPSVAEKDEASFNFTVHADVTDTAGETVRSTQASTSVSPRCRRRSRADEWQTETSQSS